MVLGVCVFSREWQFDSESTELFVVEGVIDLGLGSCSSSFSKECIEMRSVAILVSWNWMQSMELIDFWRSPGNWRECYMSDTESSALKVSNAVCKAEEWWKAEGEYWIAIIWCGREVGDERMLYLPAWRKCGTDSSRLNALRYPRRKVESNLFVETLGPLVRPFFLSRFWTY